MLHVQVHHIDYRNLNKEKYPHNRYIKQHKAQISFRLFVFPQYPSQPRTPDMTTHREACTNMQTNSKTNLRWQTVHHRTLSTQERGAIQTGMRERDGFKASRVVLLQ